ncbi:TonB family protein [Marinagarivorans cellulosilyticus]|uniref:TonB C-terminal domain-containing protein n=1 Tax=Marinagarivorans cellulosilyticus TaxID=2721545 RepID=A0AAN1WGL2_9GAMM|nr:TonB family protein [Marinagarivorans cellulosilyticus]BCD97236.1 hypothetical protein MARGE09_P1437 [Marinagarivorans cellulosilyticus]
MTLTEWINTRQASAACYLLCLLTLLTSPYSMALASSQLNGIGTYNHMGKNYYLVAYYTSHSCESTPQCEQATTPARFTLKITTPRWTAHSYSLVWQRELASNNEDTLDKANMKALLAFTRIAETQLTRGDTIDLAYDGSDTTIAVNKVFAVRAPSKTLFNYIGRVWLGPVPPSREFKQNMLAGHQGSHDQAVLDSFNALKPTAARMSLLDTWHSKKAKPAAVPKKNKPAPTTTKSSAPIPPVTPAIATSTAPKQKTSTRETNISKTSTSKTNTSEAKALKTIPPKIKAPNTKAPAPIAREQQLAALEWHIHNTLYQQVEYPAWAKQLDQQGSVSVTFTLNSQLALISIDSIEPAHAGLLGEAVANALQRSQAFSFPPGIDISIEEITTTYQHDFSLSQATPAPTKPSGISDATFEKLLTGTNNSTLAPINIDTNALRAHIRQYVDYPYWAKSLRLKGTVKALITLNAQGQLEDVTIMEGSRHAGFNKAIEDAVKKAAPYPVPTQHPDSDSLISFDYQHVFTP